MWQAAITTVLDSLVSIEKVTTTFIFQQIEGAKTEQTVEVVWLRLFMAGKVLTFPITEESSTVYYQSIPLWFR